MNFYGIRSALGVIALGCFLAVSHLSATAITGTANVTGNVVVNATSATFNAALTVPPGGMETGAFAGLTGGTYNTTTLTGVGPTSVAPFITFSGGVATPVIFDLTTILAGFGSAANCTATESTLGAECTPIGSPFTLIQGKGNVTIALTLLGNAFTGTSGSGTSSVVDAFTTQVVLPGTIGGILTTIGSGGSIDSSYSATLTATAVPEPASMLIFGMGLLGVGMVSRCRGAKL
jgi:hypothetical protein